MNKKLKALAALILAAALAACGGGGGSPGSTNGGTGSGGDTGTPIAAAVADFAVFTDKSRISNTGSETAKLTIVAVDANRNVVSNATVTVSTDQNSVYVPDATKTDATGTVTGEIRTGGDKTDRVVTVTATINGIVKRTTVAITGSKLTTNATPPSPTPGQSVTVTATLADAGGTPIVGQQIVFGGTAGLTATATTNSSGLVQATFSAPATAGTYTITATGSGTSAADLQLNVFASAIPAASIPANTTPSLAIAPNVLSVNAVNSDTNKASLRFLMVDSTNSPVENVRVRFVDRTTGLPAVGAAISSGVTTLYTDKAGTATAQYISGQNSSPTNGVKIRACYSANDFGATIDSTTGCPSGTSFVDASLTVAGQALAISIGDDNLLQASTGTYIKRFAVTVADSAGRAVGNAPVDISVDLTHFSKGNFATPFLVNGTATLALSAVPIDLLDAHPDKTTDASATGQRVWCPNEDINRNGIVDPGDNTNGSVDGNGQATLEPRKSDLLVSFDDPAVTTTNASGIVIIKVQYSQRFATWLTYKLRVTASVSGSQGMAERQFVTEFLEADEDNGSFHTPPYGVHSCSVAN